MPAAGWLLWRLLASLLNPWFTNAGRVAGHGRCTDSFRKASGTQLSTLAWGIDSLSCLKQTMRLSPGSCGAIGVLAAGPVAGP